MNDDHRFQSLGEEQSYIYSSYGTPDHKGRRRTKSPFTVARGQGIAAAGTYTPTKRNYSSRYSPEHHPMAQNEHGTVPAMMRRVPTSEPRPARLRLPAFEIPRLADIFQKLKIHIDDVLEVDEDSLTQVQRRDMALLAYE
mmetsp:Transcript_24580/g.53606  ORF Transcript_24580/g.53606 Transcript_24580/m.53606 type:complete len:140 (-) Transcript_24580:1109-1528(-)